MNKMTLRKIAIAFGILCIITHLINYTGILVFKDSYVQVILINSDLFALYAAPALLALYAVFMLLSFFAKDLQPTVNPA